MGYMTQSKIQFMDLTYTLIYGFHITFDITCCFLGIVKRLYALRRTYYTPGIGLAYAPLARTTGK